MSGGRVVIVAAGTVTFVMATPCAVSTQKHVGVALVVQSVHVDPMALASRYVIKYGCAFAVFVAAKLASGVGFAVAVHVLPLLSGMGPMPPCWGF